MSDSLLTKKAMAESLKELMKKKSLERITVLDIVRNCSLNRQTFYYHFKDKYDLVNWIYRNETIAVLADVTDGADWSTAMLNALNIMKHEKVFYIGSLSVDRQGIFQDCLFAATKEMLLTLVEQISTQSGCEMDAGDRSFIAEFCAYGLVGTVIQWAKSGMREPPAEIVTRLTHFIDDSGRVSAARYLKENAPQDGACPPA